MSKKFTTKDTKEEKLGVLGALCGLNLAWFWLVQVGVRI
jgi:hypothetical protein